MPIYQQFSTSPLLADLVQCYWIVRAPCNTLGKKERLIPGGRIEMMFNFADPLRWLISKQDSQGTVMQNIFLMGPRDRVYYAYGAGTIDMAGIRFKPGGLAAFTGVPVLTILNQVVPAEYIFGTAVNDWQALLYKMETDEDKINLLDRLLIKAVRNYDPDLQMVKNVVETIRINDDPTRIQSICDKTGWSYKKLERAFQKNAGYTPKYYCKIVRFNKALRLMANNLQSLTEVCYDCHYFDQSHFIKDFHQFAGTTPSSFNKEDNRMVSFLIRHQPV
jgi:AraC-like DNA-binding protein